MLHLRVVSVVLASGLVLGSTGMALAKAHHTINPYEAFLQGKVGVTVTDPNYKVTPGSANPFAIDGSRNGTLVTAAHRVSPKDAAIYRVSPDPFH